MPAMPPLVSTSRTRRLRASPKAWPLSQGVSGHGTRSRVVRMAAMVMSGMVLLSGLEIAGAGRKERIVVDAVAIVFVFAACDVQSEDAFYSRTLIKSILTKQIPQPSHPASDAARMEIVTRS